MPRPLRIHATIFFEKSEYDSVGPQLFGHEHILFHDFKVGAFVAEISTARPNHHVKRNRKPFAHQSDQSGTWSSATLRQSGTQLDPVCARRTGAPPRLAAALATAALRETREETGLTLPADHSVLSLVARAITPTASPIRFHARFFIVDADHAVGDHADSHELSELAFRPLEDTRKLPLMDVTEAMLDAIAMAERPQPFLFTYRNHKPWRKLLD